MNDVLALEIVKKILNCVFDKDNDYSLNKALENFAFDIELPKKVNDSTTNEVTWANTISNSRFITNENMKKRDKEKGWMISKKNINSLQELIDIWKSINLTTTERVNDSINVIKSDTIYRCVNIYRCSDCRDSKNLVFCNSCGDCEFLLASQRTSSSEYCIRCDDSLNCSNSYNVICSNKIKNSLFIQDCYDLYECMFCSHISSKRFCISNMQFEENEYYKIKESIINWIMSS